MSLFDVSEGPLCGDPFRREPDPSCVENFRGEPDPCLGGFSREEREFALGRILIWELRGGEVDSGRFIGVEIDREASLCGLTKGEGLCSLIAYGWPIPANEEPLPEEPPRWEAFWIAPFSGDCFRGERLCPECLCGDGVFGDSL